ncbi:bifunctional metallophosphatase/5'-nucleotidase [Aureibacillus halotolerans]|uniref:2',3'-cyclic-nucleotide 2'-phosphodiesterase (5'-nucleotidase family) n=1 Tax=Aureibacillus halotolerans TaxID=1508390 RepID=A0A4R6U210_9BACI|nr:bifunctional UDP-sugar hydrolase/5'-nucleotidase [Aureibacillus halotolerans]TDQ40448.1 2',3'-cyclic-nucleotide 2'-phosphodiesterase (5'-nucleotidase family) [Aureibacillus halotolerans]
MREVIQIIHTNDFHSHFENFSQNAETIRRLRTDIDDLGQEHITIDLGDHMDRSHLISEASNGKMNVRLMNKLHYQYATLGNNEGITLEKEQLDELYEEADFPLIVANLYETLSKRRPDWCKPYVIHTTKQGTKMALIGLTAPFNHFYTLLGWTVQSPEDVLAEIIAEVEPRVHAIVLLSHLGYPADVALAQAFPELNVILGAHTHHVLPDGETHAHCKIAQGGRFGEYVGQTTLCFDQHALVDSTMTLHKSDRGEGSAAMSEMLDALSAQAKEDMQIPIASRAVPLIHDWFKETNFSKLLAKTLRSWCDADIGMVNAGLLLADLPKGSVTQMDIHTACPHPINPCALTINGQLLQEIVRDAATNEKIQMPIKGLGFRGKQMGVMVYDGLEFQIDRHKDGSTSIASITIHGAPIDLDRDYRVGTIDMFTFGHLYPSIVRLPNKEYYVPEMMRDLLAWAISNPDEPQ